MNISNHLIKLAVGESRKSDHKHHVGCVIFDKKKIISIGHNTSQKSIKSFNSRFQRFPFSVHAEVDTIIKARQDLKGASLLVVRVNNNDRFLLSKPCVNCMNYIEYVGIKRVFFSIDFYPYIIEY
jgi:deoxycytidylate deaminase